MGVVRYLCITIVLACLAVSANAAACTLGQGAANQHGDCICRSGFTGAACETPYTGASCAASYVQAVNNRDDRFPRLDETLNRMSFRNNTLKLSIFGQVVPNRTYDNVEFIQPSGSATPIAPYCKLTASAVNSSFWAQSQDGLCRDRFALTMPWLNWADCGFDMRDSNDAYYIFRATFMIRYTDDIGTPFTYADEPTAGAMTRKSSVSYKVWIMFLKQITIEVENSITVNNTVGLKLAITKFEYNPADFTLTLGISSGVLYPNKYVRSTVNMTIMGAHTTTTTGLPVYDEQYDSCEYNSTVHRNCLQYFEFRVTLGAQSDCTFNGRYKLSGMVSTCRDHPQECTQALQEETVVISQSDVCGSVTANPVITGALRSYDVNHVRTSEYTIGYRGYFEADMSTVNDFNLTWVDIWVVPDSAVVANDYDDIRYPAIQWLYRDGVVLSEGFNKWDGSKYPANSFASSPVDLRVDDVTTLSQDHNAELNGARAFTPKFNFRFDSRVFNVPFETSETRRGFTLHARGHIVYAGNEAYGKKREVKVVDFVFKTDAAEMSATLPFGLSNEVATSDVKTGASSDVRSTLLKSLLPVAGIALVVVACAIAAAVVIVKRRGVNKFATLAN